MPSWWLIIRPRDKIHSITVDIQGVCILCGNQSCYVAPKLSCLSVPVAAQSKARFCSCLLVGIAGSNPAGVMDVRLSGVLCFVM